MGNARVLLVDDDVGLLRTLEVLLEDEGYQVETAPGGELALARLRRGGIHVVVSDLAMPGMDGIELLRAVHDQHPHVPFVLATAYASVKTAVEAMKLGAAHYLTKPVDPDELLTLLARTLAETRRSAEHRQLRDRTGDPERYDVLVGHSAVVATLRDTLERIALVDSTALIRGETGTGKELVARLVHRASPRAGRPFVVVNCTAIPGELVESELFGHEKGAFTGAAASRAGRVEEAEGGTLLLDEIGDMPAPLQPKLLRFLQDRTYRRVGGSADRMADVRILAATHRDLEQAIATGAFRQDLFHRLNTLPIRVPPLRDHLEDLPDLAEHLVAKIARRLGRAVPAFEPEATARLMAQTFPGNVRELENVLERALVLGRGIAENPPRILAGDLPTGGTQTSQASLEIPLERGMERLAQITERAERDLVQRALDAWPRLSNGEIADRLGTNRRVLELRMKQFGIAKRSGESQD